MERTHEVSLAERDRLALQLDMAEQDVAKAGRRAEKLRVGQSRARWAGVQRAGQGRGLGGAGGKS